MFLPVEKETQEQNIRQLFHVGHFEQDIEERPIIQAIKISCRL